MSLFESDPPDPPGRPDDVTRFTEGDCWYLAKRLHRLTGWPLMSFDTDCGEPDVHAWVEMPNGMQLDIEGVCTRTQMAYRYKLREAQIREFTLAEMTWPERPWFGHYSYAKAREVADEILRKVWGYTSLTSHGRGSRLHIYIDPKEAL